MSKEQEIDEETRIEHKLRTDWEYALYYFGVLEDMQVGSFIQALEGLQSYGWEITAEELLEGI